MGQHSPKLGQHSPKIGCRPSACHVRKFRWHPPLSFPPPFPTGVAGVRSSTILIWTLWYAMIYHEFLGKRQTYVRRAAWERISPTKEAGPWMHHPDVGANRVFRASTGGKHSASAPWADEHGYLWTRHPHWLQTNVTFEIPLRHLGNTSRSCLHETILSSIYPDLSSHQVETFPWAHGHPSSLNKISDN